MALEQFHITRLIHPAFNVRAGHIIVPVGLTNAHHEPVNFLEQCARKEKRRFFLLRGMRPGLSFRYVW